MRLIGFYTNEMENSSITLTKEFRKRSLVKNSVWVNFLRYNKFDIWKDDSPRKYSNNYVLVKGQFDMNQKGHMGLHVGSLVNVKRIEEWKF